MGEPRLSILIATTNPAKAERLRNCLGEWPFRTYGVETLPGVEPPVEVGGSHRAIAEAKALAWARSADGLALASDGGLIIPALGADWDSLTTRRAAGESAQDDDRLEHLLSLLEPYEGEERRAQWTEVVVLARNDGILNIWEVKGPVGYVARVPSVAHIPGFWAASLWYFPEVDKRYTELSADELRTVGDPWTRLNDSIQYWLEAGGWESLSLVGN